MISGLLRALAAAALLCAAPAHALGGATLYEASAGLRPGQFRWAAQTAGQEPVTIAISIALQRMYVYRGGELIGVSAVSTGKPGKETPFGAFEILQKKIWHRSNLYSNAPMPFMQRLTWDGIAIHAGANPGYPASHGCIRLPSAFAQALFAMTKLGGTVLVTDYPDAPPVYFRVEGLHMAMAADDMVTGGGRWDDRPSARPAFQLSYSRAVFMIE